MTELYLVAKTLNPKPGVDSSAGRDAGAVCDTGGGGESGACWRSEGRDVSCGTSDTGGGICESPVLFCDAGGEAGGGGERGACRHSDGRDVSLKRRQ